MTSFEEYGCGDRIYEHLRRNPIGNRVRNWRESVVSDDCVFCPRPPRRKKCDTLAFTKPLRRFGIVSKPDDRPEALKPRYSYGSPRNGFDWPSLRKSGKNLDIARAQANAFRERLIGSIRRECLDFLIPLNDRHLRETLKEWVAHYNKARPHSGLGPGIPEPSEGIPVLEISGHRIPCGQRVVGNSVLGGLHHEYRLEPVAA